MGICAGKLSTPDFLDKRGFDTSFARDTSIFMKATMKNEKTFALISTFQSDILLNLGSYKSRHASFNNHWTTLEEL